MAAAPADAPDPAAQTAEFMAALLDNAPPDMTALLWTLQDKRSSWVPLAGGSAAVADRARHLADSGNDVYVAVSLRGAAGGPDTRIKNADAAGIFGLWADIDIADPDVHKKWNLPPTIDAALELLDDAKLPPSLVIHSGHGLQAWWLFHEFWTFDSDDDRLEAAALAQRWNQTLQTVAARRSWVVDSTFDLARVMRVPGTLNRKGNPVVPVRLLRHDEQVRYNPSDIEPWCVDQSTLADSGLSPAKSYVPGDYELSQSRQPDFVRFQALLDNSPEFEATWKMRRKDLTDQSPSSYEFSLAVQAARAQWTDQELGDLFVAFRTQHKLDVSKALRKDYVDRTIIRARDAVARLIAADEMDEVREALVEAKTTGDDDGTRSKRRMVLDNAGTQLGLELVHVIKYLSDPPAFAIALPTKLVNLGGSDGILRWDKFRQSVYESVGALIPRMRPQDWDAVCLLLSSAWEEQDIGSEATERGEVAAWLSAYLAARPPVDTLQEAATSEYPYRDEAGRVLLFGPAFRRWLYLTYQERVTNKELGRRLRAYGCEPDKVNIEDPEGKRTSRGVWRLPVAVGL